MSFSGKKILGIIPARSGSKGVKNKNIKPANGKPLIAWTIQSALKSKYIDYLITSTDDEKIAKIASRFGCDIPFIRPKELAKDATLSADVILHALDNVKSYDYFILLQPTSPLRTSKDIDSSIEFCFEKRSKSCISVSEVNLKPDWIFSLDSKSILQPLISGDIPLRRQSLTDYYQVNGAIFISESKWFKDKKTFYSDSTIGYVMPASRSLDIDTQEDFKKLRNINGLGL